MQITCTRPHNVGSTTESHTLSFKYQWQGCFCFGETPNRKTVNFWYCSNYFGLPSKPVCIEIWFGPPPPWWLDFIQRAQKQKKPFSVFPRLQPLLLLSVYCQTNYEGNNRVFQMSPHFELGTQVGTRHVAKFSIAVNDFSLHVKASEELNFLRKCFGFFAQVFSGQNTTLRFIRSQIYPVLRAVTGPSPQSNWWR